MPKVGNYIQRDYHNTFRSKKSSTWSDYNESWNKRRTNAAKKIQQMRTTASTFIMSSAQAGQAKTMYLLQNAGGTSQYASTTAVMNRVNILA
ncbi:flagellar biosynthesis protein [Roseibium denhamense]|uniref:Flagellar biosynthesis protein n=1 Tax=Roseibium denhamense TaxID=76305 RepID=A0ABY1NIL0_9HYPH|nr:flagellar biosynthesis protein [Roseibium denhamense]MTI06360.1 flagellar biosynthesis protein [Roseibium denhamense]SMP08580.1 hypothetical protein SAMN06265374_0988 [Roseibium denhamense]